MSGQPQVTGLDQMAPPDQMAIGRTLGVFMTGFQGRQADVLVEAYAEDVDWTNAFGTQLKGRDTVVESLRGLFADANFDQGRPSGPAEVSLRKVTDDVVVVTTHLRIAGQGTVGGGEIALRDNFGLHVLAKQPDGSWLIVTQLFMDDRTDMTYAKGGAPSWPAARSSCRAEQLVDRCVVVGEHERVRAQERARRRLREQGHAAALGPQLGRHGVPVDRARATRG